MVEAVVECYHEACYEHFVRCGADDEAFVGEAELRDEIFDLAMDVRVWTKQDLNQPVQDFEVLSHIREVAGEDYLLFGECGYGVVVDVFASRFEVENDGVCGAG